MPVRAKSNVGKQAARASKGGHSLELVNCVATADVGCHIDLNRLHKTFEYTRYDPEMYHALVYRHPTVRGSLLVNSSGKIVFAGARGLPDCQKGLELLVADLQFLGLAAKTSAIEIRNLVFKANLGRHLALDQLDLSPWFVVEYEPEQFPGMLLRAKDGRSGTGLLFSSGACMLTGHGSEKAARDFYGEVVSVIQAAGGNDPVE
jgi:TATA-box binding protein (TBP) (component of TFIID and TFIIIB)